MKNICKLLSQKISFNLVHRLLHFLYKNSGENHFGIGAMYSILCAALIRGLSLGEKLVEEMKNINFQNLEIFSFKSKRSFTFSKYENI